MCGHLLSLLTKQVASLPLCIVSTQALLISHGTGSANLLFFQKVMAVIEIFNFMNNKDCEKWREKCICNSVIDLFEQTPPAHFHIKVVCKNGEGACTLRRLWYYIKITS